MCPLQTFNHEATCASPEQVAALLREQLGEANFAETYLVSAEDQVADRTPHDFETLA